MATNAQEWADAHTDELHNVLDDLGASNTMHNIVDARVPHRHSVVAELWKWHDEDASIRDAVETAQRLGGGFFQHVWNGDLISAFKRADSNNQRVIAEAYAKDCLLASCTSEMGRNIINERWPHDDEEQVNTTAL